LQPLQGYVVKVLGENAAVTIWRRRASRVTDAEWPLVRQRFQALL